VVTPADWQEVRLGEVLDYEQPTKYLVSSRDYVEGGMVPVLTAGKSFLLGYTDDLVGIYSDLPTIIFDDFTTATQWVDFDFKVKSSACKMLKPKRGACDLRYVYERLRALNYRTSDHKRHWISVFHTMEMRMPPLMEQEAIAETLSDADAAIESLDALIAKKRDVKQAAMQQLLTGRTRLPGFTANWKEVRLGDHASMRSGGTPLTSVASFYDGTIPWASISDMSASGKYLGVTDRHITEDGLASSPAVVFPERVLMYAMYASIGECCISVCPMATSQAILGITCASDLHLEFLFYTMQSKRAEIARSGQQGTQANLNAQMVRETAFSMPPLMEQEAIAEALSVMDDELEALTGQILKLRMVKEGMMQDLLTGKVRLV